MNKNLVISTSVLARMGLPVGVKHNRIDILGSSVYLLQAGSSIAIGSDKLEPIDLGFSLDNFNVELLIQRIHQALHVDANEVVQVIMHGIYNTVQSQGLNLNHIYIENPETGTTAILLPHGNSISISVFRGLISQGIVEATIVLPLANDPIRYCNIIKSLS